MLPSGLRVPRPARPSRSLPLLALLLAAGCTERGLPSDPAGTEPPLHSSAEQVVIRGETLTAGSEHSCGISTTGVAYCWGGNLYGQLGDGTNTGRLTPVAVQMPPGVSFASIHTSGYHTLALSTTGEAYAWGSGVNGELGDGGFWYSNRPVAVRMPEGVSFRAVSAGGVHSMAISVEGDVYAWGSNYYGQLGTGEWWDEGTPVPAHMPEGVVVRGISAGFFHSLAVTTKGEVYAWGANEHGQLGDGTTMERLTPVPVQMPAGVSFRAVGAGGSHSVALSTTGEAYRWGSGVTAPVAVQMPPGVSFRSISAGFGHNVALSSTGIAYEWTGRNQPVAVEMPRKVTFRSVDGGGSGHNVALSTTGAAYAWGSNWAGQLGDGTTIDRASPVEVAGKIVFK